MSEQKKFPHSHQYLEHLHDSYGQFFSIDRVLYQSPTDQQQLIVFENRRFGRVMALDGIVQTTEGDEFIYHEMLAHVPLFAHPAARRVLIVGGGDGGMLREVLKHSGVEQVTQVEIDARVIEFCQTHLPKHSAGAFDNPRVEIVIDDGLHYVATAERRFDVIISDSTDPIGPGEALFSDDFYAGCRRCLNPGGVLVTQNGVAFLQLDELLDSAAKLRPKFTDVHFYSAAVPTYAGGIMAFGWASDDPKLRVVPAQTLQQRFEQARFTTRYYNPAIHQAAFALPQYVLDALAGNRP